MDYIALAKLAWNQDYCDSSFVQSGRELLMVKLTIGSLLKMNPVGVQTS